MGRGLAGAAAALGVVGVLVLAGCRSGDNGRYAAEPVRTAEGVERGRGPGGGEGAGRVAAGWERLVVKDGQAVKEGQLVAELSSEQVEDQVRQAQAAVDAAAAAGGGARNLAPRARLGA